MANHTIFSLLLLALTSIGVADLCHAKDNCQPVNRDASISRVLTEHGGGKVLKVDERQGANGCTDLEIRILINGTVKAVVVKGQKTA